MGEFHAKSKKAVRLPNAGVMVLSMTEVCVCGIIVICNKERTIFGQV